MHSFYSCPDIISPLGSADHNVVLCSPLPDFLSPKSDIKYVLSRNYGKNGKAFFANSLTKTDWLPLYRTNSCEEKSTLFHTTITNMLDEHMPLKMKKKCSSDKPWVTSQFKEVIEQRQRAFNKGDIGLYRHLRNKVNRLNKQLRGNYFQEKVTSLKVSDSKKWWSLVRELTGQSPSNGHELESLAITLTGGDNTLLANKINQFFHGISCDLPKPNKDILPPRDPNEAIPDKFIIPLVEVEKQLMKLNVNKAPGPDGIPNWVLKDFAGHLAGPVCAIFNASVREGHLPSVWKSAITRPIPKVSPPKTIENDLRPISLTAILSKELETHAVSWLWDIVMPKMDPFQFGAISKCSTVHALVEMMNEWYRGTDISKDKQFIHTVLVDYSKAFDRIDPNILLEKLKGFDIPVFLLYWIFDFLSERTQRVKVGEALSDMQQIWGIVPQGTKLGVFLFLLMINDLHTDIPTFKYVDDTTIFSITNNANSPQLQQAMDTIIEWSGQNKMKINAKKTKEMLISFQKEPPAVPKISVNGSMLERVDCVTLLGVKISNTLTWGPHVDHIVTKAQKRLFCLNMLRRSKVPPKDIVHIYCAKIRPVLEYACPVWHGGLTDEQSEAIEHIQERGLRIAYPALEYLDALTIADIPSLMERRTNQCRVLFAKMQDPKDKLNRILPPPCVNVKNTRNHMKYKPPKAHTQRYKKSFLPYVLYNLQ